MLQLLRDCSGAFRPGILTALVGSSGAGKTTLMDVLAGRKTSAPPPKSHSTPGQRYDAATSGGYSTWPHCNSSAKHICIGSVSKRHGL